MGRGNDRVTRETIEAWHTEPTSINRCVVLPAAYQALRAQLIERKSKHGIRPIVNSTAGEPRTDMHLTTPQFGADEGAVMITAASITTPRDEEACFQDTNMTIDTGRQLRSMRTQTMAAPSTRDMSTDSNFLCICRQRTPKPKKDSPTLSFYRVHC
ncbi:unnamed protein product [Schistocephalus solidus]|uniref:Uncharacterized protein n=1 Tax=Schistocephalus solidus TaxID=70667 RepID=A0A183TPE0_SCHSO|nr:unnamed protein product [Schistocephalus solidus]